ncbi:protein piccolo [Diachasma alloeum]|uniref:protein piccolo n=1 Tax=Diachasma alloeum TaxID=454923 RepID=UPI0007383962|nr:protein piccolo [Diachasma alloeum]
MSAFKKFSRYLSEIILGVIVRENETVKMEAIEVMDPLVAVASHNGEGHSWRGIRHEGTQSSDQAEGTTISKSDDEQRSRDEGMDGAEDCCQPLNELRIKKECKEESPDMDSDVFPQIPLDNSDFEDASDSTSPQEAELEVKPETVSYPANPSPEITSQTVDSPEICRGEALVKFEADLSLPEGTITQVKDAIKLELVEHLDNPRVQDMDSMKSLCEEMSIYAESTDHSLSFKSLNTSGHLQGLEELIITEGSRFSVEMREENRGDSSDEGEVPSGEESEEFVEGNDSTFKPPETKDLTEILSVFDATSFFSEDNDEFLSCGDERGGMTLENSGGETSQESKADEDISGWLDEAIAQALSDAGESGSPGGESGATLEDLEASEVDGTLGVNASSSNDSEEDRRGSPSTFVDDDPFMEISIQTLDFDEEFSEESEDESTSRGSHSSQNLDDVGVDGDVEPMEIASRESSVGDQLLSVENLQENIENIPENISTDSDGIAKDDGIEFLEGDNCREKFPEKMETHEPIEEISATASGAEVPGENSTTGAQNPEDESEFDDTLSLSTTITDECLDDVIELDDIIEDLERATPLAESTGINVSVEINEGLKRKLEEFGDDVGVERAAKVQRSEEALGDNTPATDVHAVERANVTGEEELPRVQHAMGQSTNASISRERSLCREETSTLKNSEGEGTQSDSDSDIDASPWPRRLRNAARKYLSDSSEEAGESPASPANPNLPEDSPENPQDDKLKPKKKYRKRFFLKKPKTVTPASSPTPESPNRERKTPRAPKKTPRGFMKVLKPRRINLDDILDPQKRKNSSPRGCNSSDDENSPRVVKKPPDLRKKRKLFHLSDSIEDLSEFLEESPERRLERPEVMKSRVISVEYYKNQETLVPSRGVNNDSETLLTQGKDSGDLNSSSGGQDPSITSKNDSEDSEDIQKTLGDLSKGDGSNPVEEESSEASTAAGENSQEESGVDLEEVDSTITPSKSGESPEDGDDPVELLATQVSHWRPSVTSQGSTKFPGGVVNVGVNLSSSQDVNKYSESPKIVQDVSAIQKFSLETSPQQEDAVEPFSNRPQTPSSPEPPTHSDEEEILEVILLQRKEREKSSSTPDLVYLSGDEESSPAVTSELTRPLKLSSPNLPALSKDKKPEEVGPELEILEEVRAGLLTDVEMSEGHSLTQPPQPLESSSSNLPNPSKDKTPQEVNPDLQILEEVRPKPSSKAEMSEGPPLTHPPAPSEPPQSLKSPSVDQTPEQLDSDLQILKIIKPGPPPGDPPLPSQLKSLPPLPLKSPPPDLPTSPDTQNPEDPDLTILKVIEHPGPPPPPVYTLSDDDSPPKPQENPSQPPTPRHISQLQKRSLPPRRPSEPSSPSPGSSTQLEPYVEYPTDDPKGWNTDDDDLSESEENSGVSGEGTEASSIENRSESPSRDEADDEDPDVHEDSAQSKDSDYGSIDVSQKVGLPKSFTELKLKKPPPKTEKPKVKAEKKPAYLEDLPRSIDPALASKKTIKTIKKIYSQLQSKPTPEMRIKTPKNLRVTLFPHQEQALSWMLWRESCEPAGGLLADDMGLGKTMITIALIMKSLELEKKRRKRNTERRKNLGGTLVVCPANLIRQWYEEIKLKGSIPNVEKYHGTKERNIEILRQASVVITSYDTLAKNKTQDQILFKVQWKRVVLDEAHVVRNPLSLRSPLVADLKTEKRWALTGTPIHNEVKDIFPVLRFLKVEPFDNLGHFSKWMGSNDDDGAARLYYIMKCVMLRRTKKALVADDLMPGLPAKSDHVVDVVLEAEERLVYDRVMIYSRTLFVQLLHQRSEKERKEAMGKDYRMNLNYSSVKLTPSQVKLLRRRGNVGSHHILALIVRLRQSCCHPALIKDMLDAEDLEGVGAESVGKKALKEVNKEVLQELEEFGGDDGSIGVDRRVVEDRSFWRKENPVFGEERVSSKMKAVLEEVKRVVGRGEKVVVVSDWVRYLKIIGKQLEDPEKMPETRGRVAYYTGGTDFKTRDGIVRRFNEGRRGKNEEEIMVLLLSLKAGGQGLNLMGANHVMIVDVHWNPQLEVQAEDRVYRIGQTRNVVIHRFICQDTIEERIVELQKRKLALAEAVLAGSRQGQIRSLQLREMCSLFGL